ncbi:MAG TPA: hypothetical protein VIG48_04915 [Jatrophihabitans sp.]|jgi:hypothetical protein
MCALHFHAEENPGTVHHLTANAVVDRNYGYLDSSGTTTIDVGPLGTGSLTPSVTGLSGSPLYYEQAPMRVTLIPPDGQSSALG